MNQLNQALGLAGIDSDGSLAEAFRRFAQACEIAEEKERAAMIEDSEKR